MQNLLPLFIPENIQADVPRGGDVRMEDPGKELNPRSFQRVLVRECHLQLEGSILNTESIFRSVSAVRMEDPGEELNP
jgi:hypothetical protein